MYPETFSASIQLGEISGRLCGAFRPGHFSGVATVVAKLFNITGCRRAYFGLKDFQQYLVIKKMALSLNFPVEVVGCATVREPDGLAMSTRNAYLDAGDRKAACVLHEALSDGASDLRSGASPIDVLNEMKKRIETEPLVSELQYIGVYDINTLEELSEFTGKAVLACAVRIGSTRLIDNMLVE